MTLIRKATIKDAKKIRNLSLSRCISIESNERSGLINYVPPSLKKYSNRILMGNFYIAEDKGNLIGFIDSFDYRTLNEVFKKNEITSKILSLEENPFIYSNTLVLSKDYEGAWISSKLLKNLINNIGKQYFSLWGAIVHSPKRNQTSIKFSERAGFELQEEITTSFKLTFGIYRKMLNPIK